MVKVKKKKKTVGEQSIYSWGALHSYAARRRIVNCPLQLMERRVNDAVRAKAMTLRGSSWLSIILQSQWLLQRRMVADLLHI